jgi:L-2-hydroxyglutarate oxidase LhgO
MDRIDVLVVGAGVVGLAVARALAIAGHEVVITECEGLIGSGTSSRNSEVIHAGLYYDTGSAKATLCVRGKELLYSYCAERGVAHRRCGKLVVAPDEAGRAKLVALQAKGRANGVNDLELLDRDQAKAVEPAVTCHSALLSPSTGIVDSHGLMTAYLGDAENHGAMLALKSAFAGAERTGDGWRVRIAGQAGEPDFELETTWIVNAAGLDAQRVAHAMHGFPASAIPRRHVARGHYFSLVGRSPFTRLIYPTPVDGGLGVHLTLDLGGQARFGPDVEWLTDVGLAGNAFDYQVDPARSEAFYAEVRRYWPALPDHAMAPAYTGIRPKLSGPGEPAADFRIDGPDAHGCPGVVHCFGIESPGLTSSMAIAEVVAGLID